MQKCCEGEHIPNVSVTLVNRETKQEYLKIKLTDVLISSYQTGGVNQGGAVPMDQVSFNFRSVDVQAADQKGNYNQVSCNFIKLSDGVIGHNH
jgi:type VI secretion system secreted protein Hcp